jgi:hypothetical protein
LPTSPSFTDEGINWQLSFNATFNGVPANAALIEMLNLPKNAATPLPDLQQAALAGGLSDIFTRLKHEKCAAFYGSHGEDTLRSYGAKIVFGELDSPLTAAVPNADHKGMILNSDPNGAFLSPPDFFWAAEGPTQVRGFFIGHELAHNLVQYTGFFTNDNPQLFGAVGGARQAANNLRLSYNCY